MQKANAWQTPITCIFSTYKIRHVYPLLLAIFIMSERLQGDYVLSRWPLLVEACIETWCFQIRAHGALCNPRAPDSYCIWCCASFRVSKWYERRGHWSLHFLSRTSPLAAVLNHVVR